MITFFIVSQIINLIDYLFSHALNPIYSTLMNLGTQFSALQVPAIIYDVFSLCFYFLPMTTIFTLLAITCVLVGTACILSIVSAVMSFIKKIPFL